MSGQFQANIPPAPVPMQVDISGIMADFGEGERAYLRLAFVTPQGVSFFFIPEENVKEIADTMIETIQQTVSRLIVPNGKKEIVVPLPKVPKDLRDKDAQG